MKNDCWIVYLTTNIINHKIYVGVHKQDKGYDAYEFDGYLGSGKRLIRAVNKYGKDKFTRETLFVYDNPDDAFSKEREMVNEEFIIAENTYNIILGGSVPILFGEDNGFFGKFHTDASKKIMSETHKGKTIPLECRERISKTLQKMWDDPIFKEKRTKHLKTEEARLAISERTKNLWKNPNYRDNVIKKLKEYNTPEVRNKMSITMKEKWNDPVFREKQMVIIQSEERREKLSLSLTGKKKSKEHVDKINKNPEKIRKTAEKHRGMKRSDEAKKNMSLAKKGKQATNKNCVYCHNIETGKIIMIDKNDEIPEGYKRGYGPRKNKK